MVVKEIDLFEMTKCQTVYRYLLAAMYDEIKSFDEDKQRRHDILVGFCGLMKTIRFIESMRNNTDDNRDDYYDALQELSEMTNVLNFVNDFNLFIERYFPLYTNVRLVNVDSNLVDYINRDLNYLGISYAN